MEGFQRAKNILGEAQTIALIPGEDFQGDAFAASLALSFILRKLGKETMILTAEIPPRLHFLKTEGLLPSPEAVLTIDIQNKELNQLRYERTEGQLKIYLALGGDVLKESDIAVSQGSDFNLQDKVSHLPDTLVTLGILRLGLLEKIVPEANLLSRAQIFNIDNTSENQKFGSVNFIDPTSPSLSELVGDFIFADYEEFMDQKVATILLAGLLLGSRNFQHPSTGPKTFERTALLLEKGADHQLVVKHLYKTKSAAQLRLLGKTLENLEVKEHKNITLASLTQADFKAAGACSKDLAFVLEELKTNFWRTNSLLILWESHASPPLVKGIFSSKDKAVVKKLMQHVEGISRVQTCLFLLREPSLQKAKEKLLNIL